MCYGWLYIAEGLINSFDLVKCFASLNASLKEKDLKPSEVILGYMCLMCYWAQNAGILDAFIFMASAFFMSPWDMNA